MDQMTVNVQQNRAIVLFVDDMAFEDLVVPFTALIQSFPSLNAS